jgi:hypothetical protein
MKERHETGSTSTPTDVMWDFHTDQLNPTTLRAALAVGSAAMSFAEVIRQWRKNDAFCAFWSESLRRVPFDAYCFEVPPLTRDSLASPFECVFVDSPALALTAPDPEPFSEHFRESPACNVIVFENLGRDAVLVAPCPRSDLDCYTHLAAFVRHAPPAQSNELWHLVAETLETRASDAPAWLSTAGLGVYWLHVRLDSRPKYYRHHPYTDVRFWSAHG